MTKVLVAGGGIAGLSCAAYLAEGGWDVTVIEASPKLGGRAYSFMDEKSGDVIDNGQHIMMGCYENTLDFLKLVSAEDKVTVQDNLRVAFVDREGNEHYLDATSGNYPLNLGKSILKYSALTLKERLKVLDLFIDLIFVQEDDIIDLSVREWLEQEHQDENTIKALWEILAIGTLNSRIDEASAAVFVSILKRMFLGGNDATKIVLPNVGLSEMYCKQSADFIRKKGGSIKLSERVAGIIKNNGRLDVKTSKEIYSDYDFVVTAVPVHSLNKIEGIEDVIDCSKLIMKYSPILSVHLWLKENIFQEKFYGLIDSPIHWLFNHGSYISLVTSAAYDLTGLHEEELINLIYKELPKNFPVFFPEIVLSYKIIKEKRATFVPSSENVKTRNRITTANGNIILCGDWTEPMLPATIESAVMSGRKAASRVLGIEV